ncbi:MAG: hypothetical protein IB618_03010 [Candidatus Pacearchaeota archaeon]|nr:MAG: hypothetical protein IB618_03010 [Candidatus Pacearchaeota archaeon]
MKTQQIKDVKNREEIIIGFDTGAVRGTVDIMSDENLAKANVKREDIQNITPFIGDLNKNLYTEVGIASSEHPCAGSTGVNILTNDGRKASIQRIFYKDKTQHDKTTHWNQEQWIQPVGREREQDNSFKADPNHKIPISESLKFYIIDGDGKKKEKEVFSSSKK